MSDLRSAGESETARTLLLDDESVVVNVRPSWGAFVLPLVLVGLLVVAGLGVILVGGRTGGFVRGLVGGLGVLIVVGGIVGMVAVYVARLGTRYIVTDQRVLKITGLLGKTTNAMWLDDVRGVKTEVSLWQRISGYGAVRVSESNFSTSSLTLLERLPLLSIGHGLTFGSVPDVYAVTNAIQAEVRKRKR